MANTKPPRHTTTTAKSFTLPPSPSSSSDFEFSSSAVSPRKFSSSSSAAVLCPADDLFYNGQLLPLHLSPRINMLRTLLSSSSAAARDSSGSSNDSNSLFATTTDCDSSRPSSVADDDDLRRFRNPPLLSHSQTDRFNFKKSEIKKTNRTSFSTFSRFSSVFRKEPANNKNREPDTVLLSGSTVKRVSVTAREVVRKYLKKVKPLYERFSLQRQPRKEEEEGSYKTTSFKSLLMKTERNKESNNTSSMLSHSFSGNLRYPRRRRRKSCVSSCPSSTISSPSHSGVLPRGFAGNGNSSTPEELQSAIQGAIAHCKSSWNQSKSTVSNNEI